MVLSSGFEHIVRDNEPLAAYTWLRLGGAAEFFAEPTSIEELAALVSRCHDADLPVRVLGGGSNLLIQSRGVKGLVVSLSAPAFGEIRVAGGTITAGGGARLGHLISTAVRDGLSGLETLVGIPGTVGGALRGNADAGSSDLGQWTAQATVMTRTGEVLVRERDDLRFAYRRSNLDELVILDGKFELETASSDELTKRLQKQWIVKKSTHPRGHQNVGCLFKDVGGIGAAELIEQAGLKAACVGEASVCEHNANYVVANQGATSEDVLGLIDLLKNGVSERLGVDLEPQIEVW